MLVLAAIAGCASSDVVSPAGGKAGHPVGTSGVPATLIKVSGDNQTASPHGWVPDSVVVRVVDSDGDGVSGDTVTFAEVAGGPGMLFFPNPVVTDADGYGSTTWRLGTTSGVDSMSATAGGSGVSGNPAYFVANATPPATLIVARCRTQTSGGKTYNYFTLKWSGADSGSHGVYENTSDDPAGASLRASGSGASDSVEIGGYLQQAPPNYRYWWLDNVTAAMPNPTNTATCTL